MYFNNKKKNSTIHSNQSFAFSKIIQRDHNDLCSPPYFSDFNSPECSMWSLYFEHEISSITDSFFLLQAIFVHGGNWTIKANEKFVKISHVGLNGTQERYLIADVFQNLGHPTVSLNKNKLKNTLQPFPCVRLKSRRWWTPMSFSDSPSAFVPLQTQKVSK